MTAQTLIGTKFEHNSKTFYEFDGKLYLFDCTGIHYLCPAAPQAKGVFYSNEEYIQEDPEGLIAEITSASLRKKLNQKREDRTLLKPIETVTNEIVESASNDDAESAVQQSFPRKDIAEDLEVLDKDVFKPVEEKNEKLMPMNKLVEFVTNAKSNIPFPAKAAEG